MNGQPAPPYHWRTAGSRRGALGFGCAWEAREWFAMLACAAQLKARPGWMTPVYESIGSTDPARSLRQALGDALFSAADRLAEGGGVLEVRVLQGGQIVTGIVGGDSASSATSGVDAGSAKAGGPAAKFRVYIRGAQRECSCGARGGCVHIAAVSIVAARPGAAAQAWSVVGVCLFF